MRRDSSFRSASRKSASRKTRGTYARQLGYETLEDRQLLAVVATWSAPLGGTLTITMSAPLDAAVLTLAGADYKVNGTDPLLSPGGDGKLQAAEFSRIVVTGSAGTQTLTLDAGPLSLPTGLDVNDGLVEAVDIKSAIASGAAINIGTVANPAAITLENDLGTSGTNVNLVGPISLVGGARLIQTNGNPSANAGNVTLTTVNSATAGQSLFIEARAATGFNGGTTTFDNIGNGTATPLTSFEAHTNGTGKIDFSGGDVIQTDGGAIILEAQTLELATPDDLFDTELGGDDPGGAVDLSNVGQITNTGATVPHILTIDTRGTTTGAVSLPASGQFVQTAPTAGFTNYNDATFNRVRIQVATTQVFFENFVAPTAFNKFASAFFTQSGNQFVANPPKGQKAIAIIDPAQYTPPSTPLPATYNVSTAVSLTVPPPKGRFSNGYIVFDAVDAKNFKFAGAFFGRKQFSVGEVKNGKVIHKNTTPITSGSAFNLSVKVNTTTGNVVLSNGGFSVAAFTFAGLSTSRGVGVGTNNATSSFTNIAVTN